MSLSIIDTNRKVFIFACDAFWNILYRKAVIKVKINCFIRQKPTCTFTNNAPKAEQVEDLTCSNIIVDISRYISTIGVKTFILNIVIFHPTKLVYQHSVTEVASIFLYNTISVIFKRLLKLFIYLLDGFTCLKTLSSYNCFSKNNESQKSFDETFWYVSSIIRLSKYSVVKFTFSLSQLCFSLSL